jgi:hypothetical protein
VEEDPTRGTKRWRVDAATAVAAIAALASEWSIDVERHEPPQT